MTASREWQLMKVLRKIPVFSGLSPSQLKRILNICRHVQCREGYEICQANTASDAVYILLSGEASVLTEEGLEVARLNPVITIGEMGVIRGQPRTATVVMVQPGDVLLMHKGDFDRTLWKDVDMQSQIYRNIIDELSQKLARDNDRLRELQLDLHRLEALAERKQSRVTELERQLDDQRRLDLARMIARRKKKASGD